LWAWPAALLRVGLDRFVELGHVTQERADAIAREFDAAERAEGVLMVTPGVIEIVARRG
jgi:hypothetical protein